MPRAVSIVHGFVPGVDKKCRKAARLGLASRFAFVLDSHREGSADMVFDRDLFLDLLDLATEMVEFDEIEIEGFDGERTKVRTRDGIRTYPFANAQGEVEPFRWIWFRHNHQVVCFGEMLCYTAVGGPAPYSDSYAFSLFRSTWDRQAVASLLLVHCLTHGVAVPRILVGEDQVRGKLWAWFKAFW